MQSKTIKPTLLLLLILNNTHLQYVLYVAHSTQSDGPVRFLIFCSISIFLLASLVAGVQISRECTPAYLSTGILNLLQPAQAEVVLGQLSTYLVSWVGTVVFLIWQQLHR
jgi:hypothetical protein